MAHVKFSHCRMLVFQVFKSVYVSRFQCYSFEQNLTVFNTCPCIQVCHQHVLLVGNITDQMPSLQCSCTSYRCDTSTCEVVTMQLLLTAMVVGEIHTVSNSLVKVDFVTILGSKEQLVLWTGMSIRCAWCLIPLVIHLSQ